MTKNKLQRNIPDGWEVNNVETVFDFIGTYSHSKALMEYDINLNDVVYNIHYGDIHTKYNTYVDFQKHLVPHLKDFTEEIMERKLLHDGDLILADASEDYDGVCDSVELINLDKRKCISGLHTFALRDKDTNTVVGYRALLFKNYDTHNWLMRVATYSKVYGVTKSSLEKTLLLLPPLAEQKRIVGVLEVWDEGIEKLGRKIEIKENIKKGLMQQLLTGKKRLPGFSGEWEEKKLGKLGKTYPGLTGKTKKDFTDDKKKGEPFISYMNIYSNSKIDVDNINTFVKIKNDEKQNSAKYGDLFFTTSSETPDEVGISSVLLDKNIKELYLNSFSFGFRLNNLNFIIPQFAEFYFSGQSFRKKMFRIAQGASRFNLSKKYFLDTGITIPKDLKEQKEIAEVLTTADEEIEMLRKKLEILKEQKRFLLNNLITGTIRVPEKT